jgi:hypothetical protein
MTLGSSQEIGQTLLELELVTRDEWAREWPVVADMDADEVLRHLTTKGLITDLQVDKLRKGDTAGFFLGPFKLLYKISAGTFARVYRGIDIDSGDVVAIKVLRGRHTIDPGSVKQFHREAKLTESLDHPNLVRTLEVGTDQYTNQHYIAMQFVEGGNLRELLRSRKKIPPPELIRMALEMVEGLSYALSRGVTHRDIKPTNILFTTSGQIRWVDFGLAGLTEAKAMVPLKLEEQQQRTVDYAGLEKATGAPKGDPRSDIFFLGTVLYLMVTGEPAMPETKDRNARMMKARFDGIIPLKHNHEVPRLLADIVDKMLAFRPEHRYQNYEQLAKDLKNAQAALTRLASNPEAAAVERALAGFPPGAPRLMVVHGKARLHADLKEKLEKKGLQTVCTTELGRAMMLHEMKPFHCLIFDLATTGKAGVTAYLKQKKLASEEKRHLAGIFLATTPDLAGLTGNLDVDRTKTLVAQPVTLTQLKDALEELMPGAIRDKDANGAKES